MGFAGSQIFFAHVSVPVHVPASSFPFASQVYPSPPAPGLLVYPSTHTTVQVFWSSNFPEHGLECGVGAMLQVWTVHDKAGPAFQEPSS